MSRRHKPGLLVIARMSPRFNGRTRQLLHSLTGLYDTYVLSESPDGVTRASHLLDGAQITEIPLPFYNRRIWYLTGLLRVLYFNLVTAWEAYHRNYEVVITTDSTYILAGILVKMLFGRKFVYNSHEVMWALGNSATLSRLLGWLEWFAIHTCDLWLVPSEARAKLILEAHRLEKPYAIYENYPVNPQIPPDRSLYRSKLYSAGVPLDRPIVMFQGSLTEKRGLIELVEATSTGSFHLVIQGQGRLLSCLKHISNSHVTFLDACLSNEVVAWLNAADLSFVYYENDCLNSAYASSSKFFTSVFSGTPILCNRLPAFEIFAKQHGGIFFFESLDPKIIQDSIEQIFSNPELYNCLHQEILNAKDQLTSVSQDQIIIQAFEKHLSIKQPIPGSWSDKNPTPSKREDRP